MEGDSNREKYFQVAIYIFTTSTLLQYISLCLKTSSSKMTYIRFVYKTFINNTRKSIVSEKVFSYLCQVNISIKIFCTIIFLPVINTYTYTC